MTRYRTALVSISLLLASCTGPEAEEGAAPAADEGGEASPSAVHSGEVPATMEGTAWRAMSENGARFTTYLDEGGTYRDLRNGDPYGTGDWTYTDGARGKLLCLAPEQAGEPEGEEAETNETCWETSRLRGEKMIVTGPGGKRVELTSVSYEAPSEAEDDEQ